MQRPWHNLPIDITSLIINRLYYVDQIRFLAVCKSWRAAPIIKYADKVPWVMAYTSSSCCLYDPYYKRKHNVFDNKELFADAFTLDARYGWVLLYKTTSFTMFFYNPFTNKPVIKLPEYIPRFDVATFSCPPYSPDCMIFLYCRQSRVNDNLCISICKPGDRSWTRLWYNDGFHHREDLFPFPEMQYVDGVLYCCFSKKAIGVFNVARKEWKTYPYKSLKGLEMNRTRTYLTEFNGNLLIADYCDRLLKWRLFRYDQSKMDCFEVEKLDNGALFLCDLLQLGWRVGKSCVYPCSCLVKNCIYIPEAASEKLSNTVHDFYRSCDFDCRGCCWYNSGEDHSSCNRIHDDSYNKCGYLNKIWIQPPQPRLKLNSYNNNARPRGIAPPDMALKTN